MSEPWPYLTADIPGIAFSIRNRYEDFFVEEIPSYDPSGEGDHQYFLIEKRGLSTHEAVRMLARKLGRRPRDFGIAGLKDAQAVTRQVLSLEKTRPHEIEGASTDEVKILWVKSHRNKLKTGHLRGNHFRLRLRDFDNGDQAAFRKVLDRLMAKGVPNYFGSQRFGVRGDTWKTGRALLKRDFRQAAHFIAGGPEEKDYGPVRQAREAFQNGEYRRAWASWPRGFWEASRLSRALELNGGDYTKAIRAIDRKMLRFYVSAFQARLFNDYLAARLDRMDEVLPGDWACKHSSGALFKVEEESEVTRARAFEISAAGPLFGKKLRPSDGEPLAFEERILSECGIRRDDFNQTGIFACTGDRRPVRFALKDLRFDFERDMSGAFVRLEFSLPAGCYATSVLREIAKDRLNDKSRPVSREQGG